MEKTLFDQLKNWYDYYFRSYLSGDPHLDDAVRLKYDHTMKVCGEMSGLCASCAMHDDEAALAGIAALLHDVSRFEQFRIFKTFADVKSVNHADLSLMIIRKNGLLTELHHEDMRVVETAIRYHNAISVPDELSERQTRYCRLLRDADKLDIYRIVIDQYLSRNPDRAETVEVGIPEGSAVSPEVCARICAEETVSYDMITSLNDFKLIQLGWVFDLNFPYSFRSVRDRGYLATIASVLPASQVVLQVVEKVTGYLDAHCAEDANVSGGIA